MFNAFLSFSDAAKYADVARSLSLGQGFRSTFSFFDGPPVILPFFPYAISFFNIFLGIGDVSVIATSIFFFFLTLIFVYLLCHSLYKSNLIAGLATLSVASNNDLILYAIGGASETAFLFEIIASLYFVTLQKKWSKVVALLLLLLMYFTRPHAFIYIAGVILYYLLLKFRSKRALVYFAILSVFAIVVDRLVLVPLSGKLFIYSILGRGSELISQTGAGHLVSDQLRGSQLSERISLITIFKNVFYNLYNFYKLLPQIINPYLTVFFLVGLFRKGNKEFKITAIFMVCFTLIVVAISIPFFRYIHPVIPVIYIVGIATLSHLIASKKALLFLVLIFAVGQTMGVFLLDTRFQKQHRNLDKPPANVVLSQVLKENTDPNQIIITNLDTWGSWYGNRRTIWFPVEPNQIVEDNIDAIFLTSYLAEDENYYMGENWKIIFDNPKNQTLLPDFKYHNTYTVDPDSNYERQNLKAVLLIRK